MIDGGSVQGGSGQHWEMGGANTSMVNLKNRLWKSCFQSRLLKSKPFVRNFLLITAMTAEHLVKDTEQVGAICSVPR